MTTTTTTTTTIERRLAAARATEPDSIPWADRPGVTEESGAVYWASGHQMATWSARVNHRLAALVAAARARIPAQTGTLSWE